MNTTEATVRGEESSAGVFKTRRDIYLGVLAQVLFFAAALFFFAYLMRYYLTGAGGPSLLAVTVVPVALAIAILDDLRKGELYPRLGMLGGTILGLAQVAFCIYGAYYMVSEFEAIRIFRVGFWNNHDLIVGAGLAAVVMEYTRRRYFAIFVVNALLLLYTAYGFVIPGMFGHSGMTWRRIASSVSVEMSTGIFERLPQLGLTLIGSFLLVLAVLRAFGAIDSILDGASRIAARSPRLLPQAAVLGSFGVGMVSGSGAANAATTGSATIPALIKAGFPRVQAAAVETSASLGGQLMPPLMGIAAFLMAEFLGVGYFEVVARGFAPAIIYFLGIAVAVYLLAQRYQTRGVIPSGGKLSRMDWINIAAYVIALVGLIYMMGVERRAAMTAAQNVFFFLVILLSLLFFYEVVRKRQLHWRVLLTPYYRMVETFAVNTAGLTILLASLGILTAAFTITGVPTKVGVLLMEGAGVNLFMMVLVGFGFGYLIGMGLPVAPTYIVTAVVIAPFMIRAGVDPWVVHFFAFLVAVFGELSPPTSVTAAVTSRIAEAPFVQTMIAACGICIPLMVLMGAVFARPDLVVEPGLSQVYPFFLVLIGTLGIIFALQSHYYDNKPLDIALRIVLAGVAGLTVFHPSDTLATIAAVPTLALVALGFVRTRTLAKPLTETVVMEETPKERKAETAPPL